MDGRGRSRVDSESRGISGSGTTAPPRWGSRASRPAANDRPPPRAPASRGIPLPRRCPGTRQPASGDTSPPRRPRRNVSPARRGRRTRRRVPSEPSQPLLLVQHEAERPHADEVVGKRAFEEGGVAALLCGGPLSDELLYLPTPIVHFFSPFVGSIYSNCVTYTRNHHCYGDALAPCAAACPLPFPGIPPPVMGGARPPSDPSLNSPLAGASWLRIPPPLLITQRLCRVYLRGPAGGQVGGHERCRISDDEHEHERRPWHSVLHARKALSDVVYERAGEGEPQSDAKTEAQQRDEGGLDQEGEPNLPPLETQGPHHPDLLAPLHHRASRDHAQSADADHQPQAHETPQEQKDDPARRVAVPDDLGSQLCLEAVLGEVLL